MSDAARKDNKDKEPSVFLHAIERRYHQGAATLDILKSAELAVWPGQSVALIAPSAMCCARAVADMLVISAATVVGRRARRRGTAFDSAFRGEAALALQEQLHARAAAQTADRTRIPRH